MKQKALNLRIIDGDWLDRLDRWREQQTVKPSRSDAIRVAVERLIKDTEPKRSGASKRRAADVTQVESPSEAEAPVSA